MLLTINFSIEKVVIDKFSVEKIIVVYKKLLLLSNIFLWKKNPIEKLVIDQFFFLFVKIFVIEQLFYGNLIGFLIEKLVID